MRKKLGLGAGFALTAAVIAIGGCGSKKTIIQGQAGGELSNNGFPASPIANNNLASDGGGFSENNQTASFTLFTCKFNYKHPNSDAPSTADDSAMFFFVTSDNGSTALGREHVWVSYWNGSSFTPPQEITGEDRDESLTAGSAQGTHPAATVMVPLNTSSYVGNTGIANARVRANAGNWVIFWDGNTFTQNQVLLGSSGTAGILQGSAIGPHHTFWSTVFIKNQASQPASVTNLIGNTATTGTANGPSIALAYGVQLNANQVSPFRNGAATGSPIIAGNTGFVNAAGNLVKPAEDIATLAVATDTFVGCGEFESSLNGQDLGGLTNGTRIGNNNGGQFRFGPNTGSPFGAVFPASASYEVGDSTTFMQLFWVQLVTSGTGLSRVSTTFVPTGGGSEVQLGPTWQLLTANFNLATMTIGGAATPFAAADSATATVVDFPARRNTFTDGRRAAAQPFGRLVTYNNILFWNYQDTSLQTPVVSSGNVEGNIDNNGSTVLSTVAVLPGANGEATIGNQNDITLLGTGGRHQITNNTTNVTNGIVVGEEFVSLGLCTGCGVIGPDEGQVDIVAFVLGTITTIGTRGGGTLNNTDQELWAVALQSTGATAGQLQAFTNNPRRVSSHVADLPFPTTTNTAFTGVVDGVDDVKMQSSRDGTYNVLAWRQVQGTSEQANLALLATVYKVFRAVAATGSTAAPTVPTLDQRFPTANPIVVNTAGTVTYSSQLVNVGSLGGFTGAPVAAYDFQGNISYRCGFQSDRTKMSILWLYSDGTEDRLFIKLLTIGTGSLATDNPTITATNEAEIDSTAAVPALGIELNPTGANQSTKATFRFIPGSFGETIPTYSSGGGASNVGCSTLDSQDKVLSVDAGVNAAGAGGDVLVVFSKITAATNNNFDRQVIAALYNQTTVSDRVVISKSGVESTGQQPAGGNVAVTFPNKNGLGAGAAYNGVPAGFRTILWGITPNTRSSSITTANLAPDNGTYIYMGAPITNNATSARGLFTRHFRARRATGAGTAVTFANTFFPAASASTGDAAFRNPVRIDKLQNTSNATPFEVLTKGRRAVVLFTQDNHLWGTITDDGETYTNQNGAADAVLVDNNTSANQLAPAVSVPTPNLCIPVDSNCDTLSKTAFFFIKDDVNLNSRIYVRVMQ